MFNFYHSLTLLVLLTMSLKELKIIQKPKEKTANTAEQMYSFLFEFEQ